MFSEPVELNMIMDNEDGDDGDHDRSLSDSSFTGASTSKSGHDHDETQDKVEKEMRDKIIKKEEKAVRRARMMVVGAFIACATAVCVTVYTFASRADFRNFDLEVRRWRLEDDTCFLRRASKQRQRQRQRQQLSLTHTHTQISPYVSIKVTLVTSMSGSSGKSSITLH